MPKNDDIYHSILILSASEQFCRIVKRDLTGFLTIDISKSAALARRNILERYYDLVVINAPLPDETGEDFAIDVAGKCNTSVLMVVPQEVFEDALSCVTDYGILVLPKPIPRGRIEKAVRYLTAVQNKIQIMERKIRRTEEKMEEMNLINKAKYLLMEERHMTEDQAHRLIGRQAMDNGISRGRAARRILDDME